MRNSITEDMEEFEVGAEMSHLQSQMHSDYDSAESSADSDLEDGELRKMLNSAKRSQAELRKSLMSSSSQEPSAPG